MSTKRSVLVPNLAVYILNIRSGLNNTFGCRKSFSYSKNKTYQILTIKEYTHTHTHTHIYTHIYTHIHTHIHTYINTHTHKDRCKLVPPVNVKTAENSCIKIFNFTVIFLLLLKPTIGLKCSDKVRDFTLCDLLTPSKWTADRYQSMTLNKDTRSGPYSRHWRAQERKQNFSKNT